MQRLLRPLSRLQCLPPKANNNPLYYSPLSRLYPRNIHLFAQARQYQRVAPRSLRLQHARSLSTSQARLTPPERDTNDANTKPTLHENIYTIPNLLTLSRIAACPILGYSILQNDFVTATGLLAYAGFTDLLDGYLARTYKMTSVLGTILDPAADKMLMTTLAVTLTMKGLLPLPLTVIILGRDVLLSISAFWIRYTSLPQPKTFQRYWDFSIPSAEVRPTTISKVNTALQLFLMGATTVSPLLPSLAGIESMLTALQLTVATTTIWSGLSYVFSKNAVRVLSDIRTKPKGPPAPPS
ncbi:hypothetical protein DENSPDRAFT_797349 [Dentipellis sp. KUC8613]|nr:hypothetical protein DENSPDRAFT_797349 [Dentipellis sp. KUC8613]